jgi:hypothetical protein
MIVRIIHLRESLVLTSALVHTHHSSRHSSFHHPSSSSAKPSSSRSTALNSTSGAMVPFCSGNTSRMSGTSMQPFGMTATVAPRFSAPLTLWLLPAARTVARVLAPRTVRAWLHTTLTARAWHLLHVPLPLGRSRSSTRLVTMALTRPKAQPSVATK